MLEIMSVTLYHGWLIILLTLSPTAHVPVVIRGTGEGGYRGGLRLGMDAMGCLRCERGNDLSDKALHNLLHGGVGDKENVYYVRIYIRIENEIPVSAILRVIERINRFHDINKKTVLVLYFDSLRGRSWHINPVVQDIFRTFFLRLSGRVPPSDSSYLLN